MGFAYSFVVPLPLQNIEHQYINCDFRGSPYVFKLNDALI